MGGTRVTAQLGTVVLGGVPGEGPCSPNGGCLPTGREDAETLVAAVWRVCHNQAVVAGTRSGEERRHEKRNEGKGRRSTGKRRQERDKTVRESQHHGERRGEEVQVPAPVVPMNLHAYRAP